MSPSDLLSMPEIRPVIDEPRQHGVGVAKVGARLPQPCGAAGILGHGARSLHPAAAPSYTVQVCPIPGGARSRSSWTGDTRPSSRRAGPLCRSGTGGRTCLLPGGRVRADPVARARSVLQDPRAARQRTAVHRGVPADRRRPCSRSSPTATSAGRRRCVPPSLCSRWLAWGRGGPAPRAHAASRNTGRPSARGPASCRAPFFPACADVVGRADSPTATGRTARWTCTTGATGRHLHGRRLWYRLAKPRRLVRYRISGRASRALLPE